MMEKPPRPGLSMIKRATIAAVLIMLMTAGAVSAAVFLQIDDVVTDFNTAGGKNSIELPDVTPAEAGKPQTIMILGTDARLGADATPGERPRSDTIILARLDAHKDAIALMSIPRDLKVTIPGYQLPDKINAAYSNGGANLTLKTVKQLLSEPGRPFKINHVIQVSFTGFRRMVDYLGCTYIDIDRRYFNDVGGPGGYATIDIQPGYQKLCGKDALDYVRFRHTDNDLIRGARQQDFIRQMLQQPGVRQRLGFSRRRQLARIAGRYTRTDRSLSKSRKSLLSLLKLGLAVANKPVQEIPFGAGQIADDGQYLTVPQAGIDKTVDRFLNPKTAAATTTSSAGSSSASKKKRHHRSSRQVSGLVSASDAGQTRAITASRHLDFPFYYPKLIVNTSRYTDQLPRMYHIRDLDGHKHDAYRLVLEYEPGVAGEFYGVQGTTWQDPPILAGAHDTITRNGRRLMVFYDGRKVRLVAWHTKRAVYWVHNTLTRIIPYSRMVAIAASLDHLGRR